MRILVTCFDAFGAERWNPAETAVAQLPDMISGAEIIKQTLPTVFFDSLDAVRRKIEEEDPDVVLSVGQAGGRAAITVERIAVNLMDTVSPDNRGNTPVDLPIREDGPNALFATVPVKAMVDAMQEAGVPAEVSNTAGLFVCNQLMYGVLDTLTEREGTKAGFIHIPYDPQQVIGRSGVPSMSTKTVVEGLQAALACIVQEEELPEGIRLVDGWHIPEEQADAYIRERERFAKLALHFYGGRCASVCRDFKGSEDGEAVLGLDANGEIQYILHLDPMNLEEMKKAEENGELDAFFLDMC